MEPSRNEKNAVSIWSRLRQAVKQNDEKTIAEIRKIADIGAISNFIKEDKCKQ